MSKDWRTILRFPAAGIGIAIVFFFVFDKTDFFIKSWVGICMFWASLAICPGFFAFVLYEAGSELPLSSPAFVWLVIGLVNCFYYTSIGAVYVDMRKLRGRVAQI